MNYLAAFIALVITAFLTLPILYLTDDRITTEKKKFVSALKPKPCKVVGYMLRTEEPPAEDDDLYEVVRPKKKNTESDSKNWVSVYQYTVSGQTYEYPSPHKGVMSPTVRLYYEDGHPESAAEETIETNFCGLAILTSLRTLFPVLTFLILYGICNFQI